MAHGRQADEVKIFPGIGPIVAATQEEAEAKYQAIAKAMNLQAQ